MEWLSGVFDQILSFFQWIWDFFAQGVYDFIKDGLVVATKAAMYSALQTFILLLDVSFTVARELIDSLGISAMVRGMYAALPADIAAGLAFFASRYARCSPGSAGTTSLTAFALGTPRSTAAATRRSHSATAAAPLKRLGATGSLRLAAAT